MESDAARESQLHRTKWNERAVRGVQLRGVPIWRLREYLLEIGAVEVAPGGPGAADPDGVARPDGAVRGDGWDAVWRSERRRFHPRLSTTIEEHYFTFSAGDREMVDAVFERFMLKAQRGGG